MSSYSTVQSEPIMNSESSSSSCNSCNLSTSVQPVEIPSLSWFSRRSQKQMMEVYDYLCCQIEKSFVEKNVNLTLSRFVQCVNFLLEITAIYSCNFSNEYGVIE